MRYWQDEEESRTFKCFYPDSCPEPDRLFESRADWNLHSQVHRFDHAHQTGPLKKDFVFGIGDVLRTEQCGSCEHLFPERSIRHLQTTNCKHRTPFFPTESRELFTEFIKEELEIDERFVKPEVFCKKMCRISGYQRILEVIYNRWESSVVFSSLIVNEQVYDPVTNCARLYLVGSFDMRVVYTGTCICTMIMRVLKHVMAYKSVYELLSASDVSMCGGVLKRWVADVGSESRVGICDGGRNGGWRI